MATSALTGKSALIVAADSGLRELIATTLSHVGAQHVWPLADPGEALDRLREAPVDLVVSGDPNAESAIPLVRSIRQDLPTASARVPVICLSSQVSAEIIKTMLNVGANAVMTLPVTTRRMMQQVNRVLREERPFIQKPEYRGPCRRYKADPSYDGPQRRAIGAAVAAANPPRQTPPPAKPVETAEPFHDIGEVALARPVVEGGGEHHLSKREANLVAGVQTVAATIQGLNAALKSTDDAATRKHVRQQMVEAANRLINLLALANKSGPDGQGPNAEVVRQIDTVKRAFFMVTAQIARFRLEAIVADMGRRLESKEVVMGAGEYLAARLFGVEEILEVMSAGGNVPTDLEEMLDGAWDDIARIRDLENERVVLLELSKQESPAPIKRRPVRTRVKPAELPPAVGSQENVLNQLDRKGL
ncbi:MAG TPA: hypothetical protein HPP80_05245 [Rhodospirillaceae bacterium]|nr:hypothetical protein [Rhodospirillaceae bacterium]